MLRRIEMKNWIIRVSYGRYREGEGEGLKQEEGKKGEYQDE